MLWKQSLTDFFCEYSNCLTNFCLHFWSFVKKISIQFDEKFADFHTLLWKQSLTNFCLFWRENWHCLSVITWLTHNSKSQIFVQKFNFNKPPTFSRVFNQNFFWQFFSWNQSCQQLKSAKPQHFHEFFSPKIDNFLGKSKLNFWTKNEDFEQCDSLNDPPEFQMLSKQLH